jgi:hypothetical protein
MSGIVSDDYQLGWEAAAAAFVQGEMREIESRLRFDLTRIAVHVKANAGVLHAKQLSDVLAYVRKRCDDIEAAYAKHQTIIENHTASASVLENSEAM